MAERFTKLFSLPENLYAEGSPLVIAAGALQKDNQSGRVFAQLKFKSITDKTIKAVKVKLFPLDTIGNAIDGEVPQEYLDLNTVRDADFGQKTAIAFPNASTRGFSVEVAEVYFSDNSVWSGSGAKWKALPQPKTLESALGDRELVKQYRIKYGADCKFAVSEHLDLWRCNCGAWNRNGEKCHVCGMEFWFLKAADLEELKADRDARLEAQRQKAEAEKAAADAKAKKTKKRAMIIVPVVAVLIAAAVIIAGVVKKNQEEAAKLDAYNTAIGLLNNAQYAEAIAAFTALGDYKDSAEQVVVSERLLTEEKRMAELEAIYNDALSLIEYGEYQQAYDKLLSLGDYKDSLKYLEGFQEMLIRVQYTTQNTRYYNFDSQYLYDDIGQIKAITTKFHQKGYDGFTEIREYQYWDDGTKVLSYSYPESEKSEYSDNTIVGEKYIYDTDGEVMHYQQILHDGTIYHDFYIRYNEENELLSTGVSDAYLQGFDYNGNRAIALISIVNEAGNVVRSWTETLGPEGNYTGIVTNEIEYRHDEEGRVIEEIGKYATTYYTYRDDKVIRVERGKTVETYEYYGNGELKCITAENNGELSSTKEYIYGMAYVPNMKTTQ